MSSYNALKQVSAMPAATRSGSASGLRWLDLRRSRGWDWTHYRWTTWPYAEGARPSKVVLWHDRSRC